MVPAPRLTILPARAARIALVIRLGPSRYWRFFVWDVRQNKVVERDSVHGSFRRSEVDISWDGRLWLHPGFDGGLSPIGKLEPRVSSWDLGRLSSPGGYFDTDESIRLPNPPFLWLAGIGVPGWAQPLRAAPLRGRDPIQEKMRRNGWNQTSSPDHWFQQPGPNYPRLLRQFRSSKKRGPYSTFQLVGWPELLDEHVTSATYDVVGDLLIGQAGKLRRYRVSELDRGTPAFEFDLRS